MNLDKLILIIMIFLGITLLLFLYRVIKGPTVFDRLNGLGAIGTNVLLILILYGELTDRVGNFVDISLAYAILGFIGLLVLGKYFEQKGDIDK